MSYFLHINYSVPTFAIKLAKKKWSVAGLHMVSQFIVGDVVSVVFRNKSFGYSFEGICLGIKKKFLIGPESSFILRNILGGVGIELLISFFYNRIFLLKISSYKRKKLFYGHARIYFIRYKLNKHSRIS